MTVRGVGWMDDCFLMALYPIGVARDDQLPTTRGGGESENLSSVPSAFQVVVTNVHPKVTEEDLKTYVQKKGFFTFYCFTFY